MNPSSAARFTTEHARMLREIAVADDPVGKSDQITALVSDMGFGGFAFSLLWRGKSGVIAVPRLAGGDMVGVVEHYVSQDLGAADPFMGLVYRSSDPVLWAPFLAERRHGPPQTLRVIEILESAGLGLGFTIPIGPRPTPIRAAFSLSAGQSGTPEAFDEAMTTQAWLARLIGLVLWDGSAGADREADRP